MEGLPDGRTNRDEVLRGAGSRYTYSANTMAFDEAKNAGSNGSRSSA